PPWRGLFALGGHRIAVGADLALGVFAVRGQLLVGHDVHLAVAVAVELHALAGAEHREVGLGHLAGLLGGARLGGGGLGGLGLGRVGVHLHGLRAGDLGLGVHRLAVGAGGLVDGDLFGGRQA